MAEDGNVSGVGYTPMAGKRRTDREPMKVMAFKLADADLLALRQFACERGMSISQLIRQGLVAAGVPLRRVETGR